MLPSRTELILKYIVEKYVARAVPVPSQDIVDLGELTVSSATIRNEMAYLEREGYILRPHTSAGAVPSDKGYRYYVESLNSLQLPPAEQRLISHLFHQVEQEIGEWLKLATTILARQSQNVAIVTMPKPEGCQFKHLELVSLQGPLALLILVLHGVKVKQQLITLEKPADQPELSATAGKLNILYAGLTARQIKGKKVELTPLEERVTGNLLVVMQAEDEPGTAESHVAGWQFMLNQPEFAQSRQMLALMELVEHGRLLQELAREGPAAPAPNVIIGRENRREAIRDYSVVVNRYGIPDEATGTIGVIGPTRMPYGRIIATVDYLSAVLTQLVAELYGKQLPPKNESGE